MKRVTKKLLATCLSAAMMASVVPFTVLADEIEEDLPIEQEEQAEPEEEEPAVPEEIEEEDEDIIDTEDDDEEEVLDEVGINSWSELAAAIAEGGTQTIVLTDNCVCPNTETDGPLEVPAGADITLDLNGFTIDRGLFDSKQPVSDGNVITNKGTLTIKDTSEAGTGIIQGGNNMSPAGGINNSFSTSTLTILGGTIQKNKTTVIGAGILAMDSDSVVTLDGGIIRENSCNGGGAGVYNTGTFNFISGSISYNVCTSGTGGGVYTAGGPFTMSGGEISHNTNGGQCAGLYYGSSGSLTLVGGSIIDNTSNSPAPGAGVYISSGHDATIGAAGATTPLIISGNKGIQKISNFYISNQSKLNIVSIPEGSSIGISMQTAGTFTSGLGNNDLSVFTSDDLSTMVIKGIDDGEAMLLNKCVSLLGYKLSVGSSITIDYYVKIPEYITADIDNLTVTFTGDGIPTQTVSGRKNEEDLPSSLGATGDYYIFSVNVPAACMTSLITATVNFTNNSFEISDDEFSVSRYVYYLSQHCSDWAGYSEEELKPFLNSMLNYGAAAQTKFGVNTGNLANANVSQAVTDTVGTSTASSSEDPVGNLSFYKASLLCNSETTIKYYFLLPSADTNLSDYVIYVNETPLSADEITINGNPNYISISIPVSAKNYTTKYMVTVSYNGGAETEVCSYSVSDCVATIYANADESDADLKNLLLAMHDYCTYAMTLNAGN